ncbi:uncharacterized protein A1O9_04195 [Exophiala aquamarina CBS 119918]|uniref:Kelch repeat protein n=1 Tax=Exophiala aquamarina CBS 119918 TaxID=1182545 RepID=A0A072PHL9_9EURO|nr:uncharacterized protein A1O9_04195 [Exophiala aquamarina CBS 119918]KEF59351.1 hypothetical protein A1O9_04195 [Exophiala aquamarina CBS 119918]
MGAIVAILARAVCFCALLNHLAHVGVSAYSTSLAKRAIDPEWVYSAKDFFRRAYHTSVVVGNHLYIDGGEVYFTSNNAVKSLPMNSTYSIDLSASWKNNSVVLNPIEKTSPPPSLNVGNLVPDPSGTSFYQWNGKITQALDYTELPGPTKANLWQCRIDGDSCEWSLVTSTNLKRLVRSASTQGNGTAYFLGGFGDWRTDLAYYSNVNLRHSAGGLVTYEIKSQTWSNESIEGLAPTGWSFDASLHYLDGLTNQGFLLAMGGATAAPGNLKSGGEYLNPFSYVTLYDIEAKKWYNQSTSGDVPPRRYDKCSLGIPGDNGTFEIFLYGGSVIPTASYAEEQQTNIDLAEVYILSIPSFRWYKANTNPTVSRYRHTCEIVGQRQMVVIGGLTSGVKYANLTKDPLKQGLGIFDLTTLEWRSSYNASAEAYRSPDIVKEDIQQNGQYPSSWDSKVVEGWFINKAVDNAPSNATETSIPDVSSGKSSNTGAIVGGVVGGIGGLILIGLAIFFFRRRTRSRKSNSAQSLLQTKQPEFDHPPLDQPVLNQPELEGTRPKIDYSQADSGELDSTNRFELPAYENQKPSRR